ncbi:MAG: class I SAM-dependent rRNA methyltransferase [Spirochaetes bacterium]|jgi:23S rRNA (cytosine1962-C5)-methyltransferase|nr:class I SAM-dependent rRNA methyltransferase [Spirochaetota bacterium]
MTQYKRIFLRPGKEKPVAQRHPWIFSGAIDRLDDGTDDGTIVSVRDNSGTHLGYGYFNGRSQIAVRMLSFDERTVDSALIRERLLSALERRKCSGVTAQTTAFRAVFSEGDFLPGLVADSYDGHLVIQILTLGIERMRNTIIDLLQEVFAPHSIYERSDHAGRSIEGLPERNGTISGATPEEIIIVENGLRFIVDVRHGQKTGFFIDQRDNRALIAGISRGRSVLNLFSYTGGFSVAALAGGAIEAVSVDVSEPAVRMAERNAELNALTGRSRGVTADAFEYLRGVDISSDLIIIDPPAFAKNRQSVAAACRGYKELNLQAIRKCRPGALVLTCSCSRFLGMDLFQKVVFGAAADAGRAVSILHTGHHPPDHPVSIYCPETAYLKSLLLSVD